MSRVGDFLRRLLGRTEAPSLEPAPEVEPVPVAPDADAWLAKLFADVANGSRVAEVKDTAELLRRTAELWDAGHERLAIEWIEKLLVHPDVPASAHTALRAAAVTRYEARHELELAEVHLVELARVSDHAVRSNYLLAELSRQRGDVERALRHYETVLAHDVDYPNVRARVERLSAAQGRSAPSAGETLASGDIAGVSSGARYRLVRELGRGATGIVYLATDLELERDVAIKLLYPHLAAARQADAVARFFHEARITASLRHPNVVAILDLDPEARRIVMELAAGGTLRDVLAERGPRSLARALERHSQILSALAAAHRRGIVHRDIKPGNLLFRRDADLPGVEIMLGDFGVAHLPEAASSAAASSAPKKAEAVGTLAYMAPEQRRGADPAPSMDLYAAGVVFFEMITGRSPWSRDAVLASARKRGDFKLPETVTRGVAPELIAAVQEHLEGLGDPDAAGRPGTEAALAEALRLRDRCLAAG